MVKIEKWKFSRHFAVYYGDELVCVCIYRKGAEVVGEILNALIRRAG
jgi:hypothetical protein